MFHHVAYGHAGLSHMVASGLVHGVIYAVIYKVMRHLTLPETLLLAGIVLAAVWAAMGMMRRARGDRR